MYSYLVASLPFIEFDAKPLLAYKNFLDDCERLLPRKDFEIIRAATLFPSKEQTSGNAVLDKWNGFKNSLHNEFVIFRSAARSKDPNNQLRRGAGPEIYTGQIIAEAAKAPDPLSAERVIDQAQWRYLEELGCGHYFDLEVLVLYGLKLQICEKYQLIASSRGEEAFERIKEATLSLI